MAQEVETGSDSSSSSVCLFLESDDNGGAVKTVVFNRADQEDGDNDVAAAHLLGVDGDRMRCFYVPHLEKKLGYAVHMYMDLSGAELKKEHNTNASQLWLAANLPNEPPEPQRTFLVSAAHATRGGCP
eukprot:gene14179-20146_t